MLSAVRNWFGPEPESEERLPAEEQRAAMRRWQWIILGAATIGYGFFYTTRLSTSVAKNSMIDTGFLDAGSAGLIDSAFLFAYAFGKTANGFLADRMNLRRFLSVSLFLSAIINIVFGTISVLPLFVGLWALNGWLQSSGTPCCGSLLVRWFPAEKIGSRYSFWSMAHHLGEGVTFLLTAKLVGYASTQGYAEPWRAAFITPGVLSLFVAVGLYLVIRSRPDLVKLPPVPKKSIDKERGETTLGQLQLEVLRNPWIWVCGLASAFMYVARYSINNWAVFFLENAHGYSLEDAGAMVSVFPIVGSAGTLLAGPLSDLLFGSRRIPVAIVYFVLLIGGFAGFLFGGFEAKLPLYICLGTAGFGLGGLLTFLGGLIAVDITSARTAGAALGIIGGFSYMGASIQAWLSGVLIEAGKTVTDGVVSYDFTAAKLFWIAAPCISFLLTMALWIPERKIKKAT